MSELHDIDRRVAVLEQIAADTRQALQDIRSELRGLREDVNRRLDTVDRRFASLESRAWRNFYWLIAGYAGCSPLWRTASTGFDRGDILVDAAMISGSEAAALRARLELLTERRPWWRRWFR